MDGVTRARINLKEGTVELEGSEAFVSKYLEEFKLQVAVVNPPAEAPKIISKVKPPVPPATSYDKSTAKPTVQPKRATKKLKPEQFDIDANSNKPSLKDFIDQKKPRSSAAEYIAVVGYYITKYNDKEYFTEGNMEFAYRVLALGKPPLNMRQSFTDAKNKKFYVEESSAEGVDGAWEMQRIGEQFVEHDLPRKVA